MAAQQSKRHRPNTSHISPLFVEPAMPERQDMINQSYSFACASFVLLQKRAGIICKKQQLKFIKNLITNYYFLVFDEIHRLYIRARNKDQVSIKSYEFKCCEMIGADFTIIAYWQTLLAVLDKYSLTYYQVGYIHRQSRNIFCSSMQSLEMCVTYTILIANVQI